MANGNGITIAQQRSIQGKRLPMFTATLGRFDGQGPTKTEAIADLYAKVAAFNPFERTYLFTEQGDVFHVYPKPDGGAAYDIIAKDRKYPSSCFMPCGQREAIKRAEEHAAQAFGGIVGRN